MGQSYFERLVNEMLPEGIWRDLRTKGAQRRAPERDVSITSIERVVVDGNYPWNLIKVETDVGEYGLGEANPGPVGEYIDYLEPALVGENPLDVDRLVEHMTQLLSNLGGTVGYSQAAVSGIETALWDAAGKLVGVPAYQLLGGKYRDEVQVYVDCHAGEHVGDAIAQGADGKIDPELIYDPEAYADEALEVVDDGFDAIKFDLDVPYGDEDTSLRRLTNPAIDHKVAIVEAIRDEIGTGPILGVDLHWNFTVETATRLVSKLEPYDLDWIEDPVPPENADAHQKVTDSTVSPILTGENLVRVEGFQSYITEQAVDLLCPDVQKCGGMLEFRKIATLADAFDMPLVPHNLSSPVGAMATAQACATIPNAFAMEWHAREVPWWDDLTIGDRTLIQDGTIAIPEAPGLGIELDESELNDRLVADQDPIKL